MATLDAHGWSPLYPMRRRSLAERRCNAHVCHIGRMPLESQPLEKDYDVVWFDNRGIGESPGAVSTVQAMGQDGLQLMDTLGWRRAHLVGHSLGGAIAQQMAIDAPDRVQSLSLLCTYARGTSALSLRPADLWLNLRTAIGTQPMRRETIVADE